jgi:molybdopterin/thiamine biosynthesis adenylyltransferase
VDNDSVDLTNLQRQIAHTTERVGQPKALSARRPLQTSTLTFKSSRWCSVPMGPKLDALVATADVVLDCCDNFATRQAVNAACVRHRKPLVSGAAVRFDGQLAVYDPRSAQSPCYACVFPPDGDVQETQCATLGVFAPLVGIIGAMQAAEALKLLAGVGTSAAGRLLMLDGRAMEWSEVRTARDPACPVCGGQHH